MEELKKLDTSKIQIVHYGHRKCRFSESVDFRVNGKTITTPTFAPRIKNDNELDIYLDVKTSSGAKNLSAYVVRLFDTKRTIQYRLKKSEQRNLIGETLDPKFSNSLKEDIILIDPALEYLYYYPMMNRLRHSSSMPRLIRKYAEQVIEGVESLQKINEEKKHNNQKTDSITAFRDAQHTNFWSCIYKDANSRIKLIRDTCTSELQFHSDILIPPVPLITNPHLLKVTFDMNEKFRALSSDKGECADYFILKQQILKNESVMDSIKAYVADSESALTIFKLKYADLTNPDYALERNAVKKLFEELFLLSQHTDNKAFALFEAGYQTFPAALCSFALVSTAYNLDRGDRRATQGQPISEYANWYDPESMTLRNHDVLSVTTKNNNGILPCYCPECTKKPSLLRENPIEYNKRVKRHFLFSREYEMQSVIDAIERQNVSMGFDKLQRSDLRILTGLLPR